MQITFSKYQGAGNDFIMIDNRNGTYNQLSIAQISFLCNRRFGIGADGLIKINTHNNFDFEVDYYNADGSKSFCGNGGRCAVSFSNQLGINVESCQFLGYDGVHQAKLINDKIHLEIKAVYEVKLIEHDFEIYTGSPHYIRFEENIDALDMYQIGREIRYSESYLQDGINVNLVERLDENKLFVRTYERGVENETLACGTGVTAAALAYAFEQQKFGENFVEIKTKGGNLAISFEYADNQFHNIWLIGTGDFVFNGSITI